MLTIHESVDQATSDPLQSESIGEICQQFLLSKYILNKQNTQTYKQ